MKNKLGSQNSLNASSGENQLKDTTESFLTKLKDNLINEVVKKYNIKKSDA